LLDVQSFSGFSFFLVYQHVPKIQQDLCLESRKVSDSKPQCVTFFAVHGGIATLEHEPHPRLMGFPRRGWVFNAV